MAFRAWRCYKIRKEPSLVMLACGEVRSVGPALGKMEQVCMHHGVWGSTHGMREGEGREEQAKGEGREQEGVSVCV